MQELEAALEVMELELQVSQAEKRLKKARKAQMDREHEALKVYVAVSLYSFLFLLQFFTLLYAGSQNGGGNERKVMC